MTFYNLNAVKKYSRGYAKHILFFYALILLTAAQGASWTAVTPGVSLQPSPEGYRAVYQPQQAIERFTITAPVQQDIESNTPVSFRYRVKTMREILNLKIVLVTTDNERFYFQINRCTPDEWHTDSVLANDLRNEKFLFIRKKYSLKAVEYDLSTRGNSGESVVLEVGDIKFEKLSAKENVELPFVWPKNGDHVASNPPFIQWNPISSVSTYYLQVSQDSSFFGMNLKSDGSNRTNVNYCTPNTFLPSGTWYARVGYQDSKSEKYTDSVRFIINKESRKFVPLIVPDRLKTQHPYLYVTPAQLFKLRQQKDGVSKALWEKTYTFYTANSLSYKPEEPPKFPNGVWDYQYWLKIDSMAGAAQSHIFYSGFVYLLSGDTVAAENARRIMLEVADWDYDGATGIHSVDHAAQGLLYSMSLGYDWLYDYLNEADRAKIRGCITKRGRSMYEFLNPLNSDPTNNHPWFCTAALGIGGLAIYNEVPEAKAWVDYSQQLYLGEYLCLGGSDGEWHEGIDYWSYTLFFVFQYADCMNSAAGINLYNYPWLEKTAQFKILSHPPVSYGLSFGDSKAGAPVLFDGLIMSRLASQNQDSVAQWYASIALGDNPSMYTPYLMFWWDRDLAPSKPEAKPLSALYREWGVGLFNSDLASADNTMLTMKSGPYIGRRGGHAHPDQNSFVLYPGGDLVLIDSGYYNPSGGVPYGGEHHMQWTLQTKAHNLPLVDGMGQAIYTAGADGKITAFLQQGNMSYMCGDASNSEIYQGRMNKFKRHVYAMDTQRFMILDELASDKPSRYDWLLHSMYPFNVDTAHRRITINGNKSFVDVRFLNPEPLSYTLSTGFPITPPRKRSWDFPEQYHFAAYPDKSSRIDWETPARFGEPESMGQASVIKKSSMNWLSLYAVSAKDSVQSLSIVPQLIKGGLAGKIYLPEQRYYYLFADDANKGPLSYVARLSSKGGLDAFIKALIPFQADFIGKGAIIGTDNDRRINRLILVDAQKIDVMGMPIFKSTQPLTLLADLQKKRCDLTIVLNQDAQMSLNVPLKPFKVFLDGKEWKQGNGWSYNTDNASFDIALPAGKHTVLLQGTVEQ